MALRTSQANAEVIIDYDTTIDYEVNPANSSTSAMLSPGNRRGFEGVGVDGATQISAMTRR